MPESTAHLDTWPALGPDADPKCVRLYTVDLGPEQPAPPPVYHDADTAALAAARKRGRVVGFFEWYHARGMLPLVVFERSPVARLDMIDDTTGRDHSQARTATTAKREKRNAAQRRNRRELTDEQREAHNARQLTRYQKIKADPDKYAALLQRTRENQKKWLDRMTPQERADYWHMVHQRRKIRSADKKPRSTRP